MKTYKLGFKSEALKEWKKLGSTVRDQFRKKLQERLADPHVPSARLHGLPNCYKIKLRAAGYRLIYQVEEDKVLVIVVAVGPCDRNLVYKIAMGRVGK